MVVRRCAARGPCGGGLSSRPPPNLKHDATRRLRGMPRRSVEQPSAYGRMLSSANPSGRPFPSYANSTVQVPALGREVAIDLEPVFGGRRFGPELTTHPQASRSEGSPRIAPIVGAGMARDARKRGTSGRQPPGRELVERDLAVAVGIHVPESGP